ncbi:MAG: nucleotidyltransferase family protein [Bacteroidetes bacterium]|nr:nucleotidyltransferase family protein [Bacteroidota bacterium]
MECIVLAGGLGTRLRHTIGDFPKCMALVNGKPFLHYIFHQLKDQKCKRVILALGYKHDVVTDWLKNVEADFEIDFVIEDEPLGTGGGIAKAASVAVSDNIVVLNGDTFFDVDLNQLIAFHLMKNASTTLALKEMRQFERYGSVTVDESDRILSFEEKKFQPYGFINGGLYVVNKESFLQKALPLKFSFEKDYLETFVQEGKFFGQKNKGYFIDIGVPDDYAQAQIDFSK